MGKKLEQALGILNGAVGDHLARTGNGLATEMSLVHLGEPLPLGRAELRAAFPGATPRIALLVHGVMGTEEVFRFPDGSDYGARLAADLGLTPLYLRYNSGRAIADSGAALDALLETLFDVYPLPLEALIPIGYSMGGLVVRSACHAASLERHRWLPLVERAIYVGTPHRGAPLERLGRGMARVLGAVPDPVTRLIAQIADLRSEGVKDLGDADLRHEDRLRRALGTSLRELAHPVPLLPGMTHSLIAGSLSAEPWLAALFGDAMVSIASATDGRGGVDPAFPPGQVKILGGISHLGLAHDPRVYAQLRAWCEEVR